MGNMEPRRLHERGEEMGERRGGIQEVPCCLVLPRELPFICGDHNLLKNILTRPSPSSQPDEGCYQGRHVCSHLYMPEHPSPLLCTRCHLTTSSSVMPRGLAAFPDQEGPG